MPRKTIHDKARFFISGQRNEKAKPHTDIILAPPHYLKKPHELVLQFLGQQSEEYDFLEMRDDHGRFLATSAGLLKHARQLVKAKRRARQRSSA